MKSSSLLALAFVSLLSACSSSSGTGKSSSAVGGGNGTGTVSGSVDPSLVGSWYAGRGGTQIAYDTSTGTFGAPSGSGMMFVFHDDGTYQKAVQSIESGACTTGFVTVESGVADSSGARLELHPSQASMHEYSCSGTADNDHPVAYEDATLEWQLDGATLQLVDANGASAAFQRTR